MKFLKGLFKSEDTLLKHFKNKSIMVVALSNSSNVGVTGTLLDADDQFVYLGKTHIEDVIAKSTILMIQLNIEDPPLALLEDFDADTNSGEWN